MTREEYDAVEKAFTDVSLPLGAEIATPNFVALGNGALMPVGIDPLGRLWRQDRGKVKLVALGLLRP